MKKETMAQVFSREFRETSKNTSYKTPLTEWLLLLFGERTSVFHEIR